MSSLSNLCLSEQYHANWGLGTLSGEGLAPIYRFYAKAGDSLSTTTRVDMIALRTNSNTNTNYMSAFYGDDSVECLFRYDNSLSMSLGFFARIYGVDPSTGKYYGDSGLYKSKQIDTTDLRNYKVSDISSD